MSIERNPCTTASRRVEIARRHLAELTEDAKRGDTIGQLARLELAAAEVAVIEAEAELARVRGAA